MSRCALPTCTIADPVLDDGHDVCRQCRRRLTSQLREIGDYLWLVTPQRLTRPAERGSPGYASSSPADDTVIAMLDPRSHLNGGFDDSAPADDYEDSPDHVVPVVTTLAGWAQHVAEGVGVDTPPDTLSGAVRLLRSHIGWMSWQDWIVDAAAELDAVHRQLAAAVGDQPDKPIAVCIDLSRHEPCGGAVYWAPRRGDEARCSRCKRPYRGLDLIRLRVAQQEAS